MALKAMRFSSGDLVRRFLKKYDDIAERDRNSLSIEAIALSEGIDVSHLLGEIALAMREYSVTTVKMIAVSAHPDTMKARVKFAKQEGGSRDRDALDTMLGALPPNKGGGSTFINKFFAGGSREVEEPVEIREEPPEELVADLDFCFPDSDKMQGRLQPMRQRLLEERE